MKIVPQKDIRDPGSVRFSDTGEVLTPTQPDRGAGATFLPLSILTPDRQPMSQTGSARALRIVLTIALAVAGVALAGAAARPGTGTVAAVDPDSPFGVGGAWEYSTSHSQVGSARTFANFAWPEIEPAQNAFRWGPTDRILAEMHNGGLEPMMKINTCGLTEDGADFWATVAVPDSAKEPPGVCTSMPPERGEDYDDFIFRVVDRYKDTRFVGTPVRHFAIGNEANDRWQWPGRQGRRQCVIDEGTGAEDCPPFQAYIKLLRRARAAAHAANPNSIVLDSGLGSRVYGAAIARDLYQDKGRTAAALKEAVAFYNAFYALRYATPSAAGKFYINPSPQSTLRARWEALIYAPFDPDRDPLLSVGVGDRFYYFAKHMYDDPTAFDAVQLHFYDNWDFTDEVVDWIHRQMDENWGPGNRKPILCWECGSHTPLVDPDGDGWGNYPSDYDVDDNASWVAKKFILGLSRGVEHLVHFGIVWENRSKGEELFRSPPLICGFGSRFEPHLCGGVEDLTRLTPQGKAYRKLATTLRDYASVTEVSTFGPTVKGFRFAMPRFSIVTLWSDDGSPRSADLTLLGTVKAITDQYGSALSGDPRSFTLDEKVVYVKVR